MAIEKNRLPETEAEQLRLKLSAALSSARLPPSNISTQERKALNTLQKDPKITILPALKGRLHSSTGQSSLPLKSELLIDSTTYEFLRQDPTNSYKLKVVNCLKKLEREQIID